MAMDPRIRLALTVLISLLVIGGFAAVFAKGILDTWQAKGTVPPFSETYLYVATALAGLVGGLVAAGFGQKLPETPPGRDLAREAQPSRVARRLANLGAIVLPGQTQDWQRLMASLYAVVYILWGVLAIITWVAKSPVCPDLVKNLASISFGLFLAIARGFLSEQ